MKICFAAIAWLVHAASAHATSYSIDCSVGGSTATGTVVSSDTDSSALTNTVNISNIATGAKLIGEASTPSFSVAMRVEPLVAGTSTSAYVGASYYGGITGFSITVLDGSNFTGLQIRLTDYSGYGSRENWRVTCPGTQTLSLIAGSPQIAAINTAFATPLQARLTTNTGAPVSGSKITFSGPASGATAFMSSTEWTTDSNGMISVPITANGIAGSFTLTATTRDAPVPLTFDLTNSLQSPQTITFARPPDAVVSPGTPISLTATASSNLPVSFASLTPSVCSVSAATVTLVSAGSCSIKASQAGNASFLPAPDVTQAFNAVAPPRITAAGSVSPATYYKPGTTLLFTFTLMNSGSVPATIVGLTDTRLGNLACTPTVIPASGSASCTGSTVTTANDLSARSVAASPQLTYSYGLAAAGAANVVTAPLNVAVAATIDVAAVQAATRSAIQGMLSARANFLSTNGPSTERAHARLSGGSLFEQDDDHASGPPIQPRTQGGSARSGFVAMPAFAGSVPNGSSAASAPFALPGGAPGGAALSGPLAFLGSPSTVADRFDLLMSGRLDAANRPLDSLGGNVTPTWASSVRFSGNGDDNRGRFAFASSLADARQANAGELASAGKGHGHAGSGAMLPFDIWVQGTASYFTDDRHDGKRKGNSAVVHLGADWLARPGLLLGIVGSIDWMADAAAASGLNRDGLGWMIGPYMSARVTKNLYFDGRWQWGLSNNHVNPLGAYSDTFRTSRSIASAKLTGDWMWAAWRFRPSAELIWFNEKQLAYVNAIGIAIPGQTYNLGRTIFGPEIGYRFGFADKSVLEPFVGIKGAWDFGRTRDLTAAGTPVGSDGLRALIEGGATYRTPSGVSVRASASYDGIGATGYRAVQGRAQLTMPLW